MRLNEYQKASKRTLNNDLTDGEQLGNMIAGIMGESGEVADILKKHLYQEHPLDVEHISEELGDTMFYIVNLCNLLGLELEDVIEGNHWKLMKRYPKGFDSERSVNRER